MTANIRHYKRLRMQLDLRRLLEDPQLPDGYQFVPWQPQFQERHAQVQWRAFRNDVDGQLFLCLSNLSGCRRLLRDTVHHSQFSEYGTWLVQFRPSPDWPADDCAMIQGLVRTGMTAAIQNLGVVPEHRGYGVGKAVLLKALHGLRSCGARRATLEVTANNHHAVCLYLTLGFQVVRVLYRTGVGGSVVHGSERPPYKLEVQVPVVS